MGGFAFRNESGKIGMTQKPRRGSHVVAGGAVRHWMYLSRARAAREPCSDQRSARADSLSVHFFNGSKALGPHWLVCCERYIQLALSVPMI